MPKISVIVPVYKAEAFLEKCVGSILGQTFPNLELLLIDDGSPDNSGALCDRFAAADSRVRVFHKPNGGVSSARNLGLREARGDFIAFADSDDWLAPDALETFYYAAVSSGADTAGSPHMCVAPWGEERVEPGALPPGLYDAAAIREGIVDRLVGDRLGRDVLNGFIWRFLFSRSIIREQNIAFEGAYLEDELFLLEYFCHAEKLVMVEKPLYYYLENPASVTRRYLKDYMDTYWGFFRRKEALVQRLGLAERRPQWRESTNWAGLLIAVGNEYAAGNPASAGEKKRRVRSIAESPEMAQAVAALHPRGLSRNKQLAAELLRRRQYGLLTLLYQIKNRGK